MERELMTNKKLSKPLNFLIKRRGATGDVIMTTGIAREVKKAFGDNVNISIATDCLDVYKNNPHISNIIPYDAADANKFDWFVSLDDAYENEPGTNFIDAYYYGVFGDLGGIYKNVELFPSDADVEVIDEFIESETLGEKFIVVHLRNWHWQAKNIAMEVWFDVFAKLFEEQTDFKIVTVGGPTDHSVEHPNFVDARTMRFTPQQLKVLCDRARCFVGIDSAPFWCAAASDTTIVALLTHLLPERIMPHRRCDATYGQTDFKTIAISTLEDCKGCNDRQQHPVRQIVCEKGDYPCTRNFDTNAIAKAILNTL
jgi:ADP-heptose:LPS heptosyltransferase